MRIVALLAAVGALVGTVIAVIGRLTTHTYAAAADFGWYAYGPPKPRRYADYLPLVTPHPWWPRALGLVGTGVACGAVAGLLLWWAGFRLTRRHRAAG